MIRVTNIRNIKKGQYDEVWAIVRSLRNPSLWMTQVPELSPSMDLFMDYRRWTAAGEWNAEKFQTAYVPRFLSQLRRDPKAAAKLNELYKLDKRGKRVAICCFCADEGLCHRSVVAGLLQGAGARVETDGDQDLSAYYDMYNAITK